MASLTDASAGFCLHQLTRPFLEPPRIVDCNLLTPPDHRSSILPAGPIRNDRNGSIAVVAAQAFRLAQAIRIRARYSEGEQPIRRRNSAAKWLGLAKPTSAEISFKGIVAESSSALARSSRTCAI